MVDAGDRAPDFCLPDSDLQEVCLGSYVGRWVVLYFYPRDNTSACTKEAQDFTASREIWHDLGAEVVAISPDSPASHAKFASKHSLTIRLLSDREHTVMGAYGVWNEKKIYGRIGYGVTRSTFLIDPQGIIARVWRSVKVRGHVDEVVGALRSLRETVAVSNSSGGRTG